MFSFKNSYGSDGQIRFNSISEFYKLLGFLAKPNATRIVWEHNEQQGAWGSEGRIQFFVPDPGICSMAHTAGVGNIISRVNCNEFVEEINLNFGFVNNAPQDVDLIRSKVPDMYRADFDDGFNL